MTLDPEPIVPRPLDLTRVKVLPLESRRSLSRLADALVSVDAPVPPATELADKAIVACAQRIRVARERGASVMLIYGAHLVKNGLMAVVNRLLDLGWVTHLATNGAGTIHDWEFSYLGRTEESVRENVATGSFGTWDETGRYINLAVLAGGLRPEGYGGSLGRFIREEGATLPSTEELKQQLRTEPEHPLAPARADLLQAMLRHGLPAGRIEVKHCNQSTCILARAFVLGVPMTVHPGIGYDIITTHPMFSGAAIGRAAGYDFALFSRAVDNLDGGVVLSVGSAIMGPQVFEKSLSCVNNLRLNAGRHVVKGHAIYVVDIQEGGKWDWTKGEPPKSNPAYYLRFCKSFARMGGDMNYVECDNKVFLQRLLSNLANCG
jgi:hypothetical protein